MRPSKALRAVVLASGLIASAAGAPAAQAFADDVRSGAGQQALRQARFRTL